MTMVMSVVLLLFHFLLFLLDLLLLDDVDVFRSSSWFVIVGSERLTRGPS